MHEQEALAVHVERPPFRCTVDLRGDRIVTALNVAGTRAAEASVDLGMSLACQCS